MKNWLVQSIAPLATVAMMVGYATLCGCDKKPDKPDAALARANDPVYQKALQQTVSKQTGIVARRERIIKEMQTFVSKARAALPKDATDVQVKAELDNNPKKYPGWDMLSEAIKKANTDLENEMTNARNTVRARILKEKDAAK